MHSTTHSPHLDSLHTAAQHLENLTQQIAPRFFRTEIKQRATEYLKALIAPVERKNSWQIAEAAGAKDPAGFQHLLHRARWDADGVRDDLRQYVVNRLGHPEGVLVLDETGFLKKGDKSAGVQRQYSGMAGRIENCQIGVFLVYASPVGAAFIDRELYLPKRWTEDRERCRAANIPHNVEFATKLQLARQMLTRAIEAKVPAQWVTGDAVYGSDHRLRQFIGSQGLHYVLAVSKDQSFWIGKQSHRVDALVSKQSEDAWQTLSAGRGSKGRRLYQWIYCRFEHPERPELERGVLARRSLQEPTDIAYYLVSAPAGTSIEQVVRIAGVRWTIETCFQTAKAEVGLDHYEVRSWHGWYRHITLCLLAHAFLTVMTTLDIEVKKGDLNIGSLFEFKHKRGLYYL